MYQLSSVLTTIDNILLYILRSVCYWYHVLVDLTEDRDATRLTATYGHRLVGCKDDREGQFWFLLFSARHGTAETLTLTPTSEPAQVVPVKPW